MAERRRPRVVIIGGGFGGLYAARALRRASVEVLVLDRTNHHLFQPLLYQVATATLAPTDITAPIRWLLRKQENTTVLMAEVDRIDVDRRVVGTSDGEEHGYDYLIVAAGARHSYFAHPEWERHAPGLKSIDDAIELRRRVLTAFERAEATEDPAERAAWLTFVVVGGGPTGVELTGMLPTIARRAFRRDFRRIDTASTRVVLLEGGPRILASYPETLSEHAQRDLVNLGVEVRTGALVSDIGQHHVTVDDRHPEQSASHPEQSTSHPEQSASHPEQSASHPEQSASHPERSASHPEQSASHPERSRGIRTSDRIHAHTILWGAGNAASPLGVQLGAPTDRAGRVQVGPDLSLPAHPEVFVIGDLAATTTNGRAVPGVAPAAMQMGALAARNIGRDLEQRDRLVFAYKNKGDLATIGRNRAIADLGRFQMTGALAWWFWLLLHIMYLAGFRNRLSVMIEWAYSYFTFQRGARLITGSGSAPTGRDATVPGGW